VFSTSPLSLLLEGVYTQLERAHLGVLKNGFGLRRNYRAVGARAVWSGYSCACFVPAALLAVLRTALALRCVSKAKDWSGHVVR
jgi:hypothetical protein